MPIKFILPEDSSASRNRIANANGSEVATTAASPIQASGLATPGVAHTPLTKMAQFAGSGANVIFTQPMFFSPLHTPQNWQQASKRREQYQWSFISPCNITSYDDFSLIDIADVYKLYADNVLSPIQDGFGEKRYPNKFVQRHVKKQANRIKVAGVAEPLTITNDHNCRIIKREDIKCVKSPWNSKLCVFGDNAPTCQKYKCDRYKSVDYKISKVKAKDVKKGDFVLVPFSTEVKESIIKNINDARFAGHLASDGYANSHKHGKVMSFVCMSTDEIKHVFPCVSETFSRFGVKAKLEKNDRSSKVMNVRSGSKKLFEFSGKLISGRKAVEKQFTKEVVFLDPKLQLHVLGAYIQSDGTYNEENDCLEITTYSPHLANQLIIMFYRCGILARVNKQPISRSKKTFKTDSKYRYILSVASSECHKIKEYVPHKARNHKGRTRQQNKRFFWKNFVVAPVSSNESFDYEGPVYDIRVPPTHTITVNGVSVYQCRFWVSNEPKVAAAIDFYSGFPMRGFKLEFKDKKILEYYEKIVEDLDLEDWMSHISYEYYMLGDVFPFLEIDCKHCGGAGFTPDGDPCNHADGNFRRIVILNPDYIEVQNNVLAEEPVIALVPDEELRMLIQRREPRQIYDKLPKKLIDLVASGRPIPLSNRSVGHIKHGSSSYATYGESIQRRLFTILSYKTKIMTANWIVAERMIVPLRIVKVGDSDRPASEEDLSNVQNQLAAVANDPNLTLVTHHAFDLQWEGACYSSDTEILTKDGWKYFYEIDKEREIVATYNLDNQCLEYQEIDEYHEYDFESTFMMKMYNFKHKSVDVLVTPNHRMLIERNSKMQVVYSQDVKHDDKFISTMDWNGFVPDDLPYVECEDLRDVDLNIFLKFAGYYVSEGSSKRETRKNLRPEKEIQSCSISQSLSSVCFPDIKSTIAAVYPNYGFFEDDRRGDGRHNEICGAFNVSSVNISRYMAENFGSRSIEKRVPNWIKDLPKNELKVFFEALVAGDGAIRTEQLKPRYVYTTASKQLADDVSEICLKLGYFSTTGLEKRQHKNPRHKDVYKLYWSDRRKGIKYNIRKHHIHQVDYHKKVYCVKVPNTFVVVRRNGRISVQGNTGKIHGVSGELEYVGKEILDGFMLNQALLNGEASGYSSAQVGVEVLLKRLEGWQNKLAKWVEKHIFEPIAMMQGFVDEKKSTKDRPVYQYPKIKWNDLQLRDKSNMLQLLLQLYDKGLASGQKICEEFDLDYDLEQERIREEQVVAMASGQLGGPAAQGGNLGTMGMGGMMGGGGGAPGEMPGMEGGMPGMEGAPPGGGMPGAGGAPGGMPGAGGAPGGGMPAAASAEEGLAVPKRGKGREQAEAEAPQQKIMRMTSLESKMYKMLTALDIPFALYGQYQVSLPGQQQPFLLDFAYPEIGVCCEVDGKIWHEREDIQQRDKMRDQKLANVGWRILRFKEDAMINHADAVRDIIYKHIVEAAKALKKAAETEEGLEKFAAMTRLVSMNQEGLSMRVEDINDDPELGILFLSGESV